MSHTTVLTLTGLSCGHCIKRVKEFLEKRDDVGHAEVSFSEARILSTASAQALIAVVEQAGYHASQTEENPLPKSEPLTVPDVAPEALEVDLNKLPAQSENSANLIIDGMSCASCVTRVEQALTAVPGVSRVRVNLAERTALVTGDAGAGALIESIQRAGYDAEIVEDDRQRRKKQQQAADKAIRRFRWQTALALALGVPLMIWGMVGDGMVLTESNRTHWLLSGFLTLLVMVVSGGHFYRNAWRSLLKKPRPWILW